VLTPRFPIFLTVSLVLAVSLQVTVLTPSALSGQSTRKGNVLRSHVSTQQLLAARVVLPTRLVHKGKTLDCGRIHHRWTPGVALAPSKRGYWFVSAARLLTKLRSTAATSGHPHRWLRHFLVRGRAICSWRASSLHQSNTSHDTTAASQALAVTAAPSGLTFPGVTFLVNKTTSSRLRIVSFSYTSPYGRQMIANVFFPARPITHMAWVWRLAPTSWGDGADACSPFWHSEMATSNFVFICAQVDNSAGPAGVMGYDDPAGISSALAQENVIASVTGSKASSNVIIGSSASAMTALYAVALNPTTFSHVFAFDSPVDQANRYASEGPEAKLSMEIEFGGPPVGDLLNTYIARSPIGHIHDYQRSSTQIHLFMSRTDRTTCVSEQIPGFVEGLLSGGGSLSVGTGTWEHGASMDVYGGLILVGAGIVAPTPDLPEPNWVTVTAATAQALLGCA